MTPDAYRTALGRAGLTYGAAARLFDVEERRVRRWASEGPPDSVAFTLMLMARYIITPQLLCRMMIDAGYEV